MELPLKCFVVKQWVKEMILSFMPRHHGFKASFDNISFDENFVVCLF